ncbi:MAG: TonB-dependent receptor [Blastocatellia bacterium]
MQASSTILKRMIGVALALVVLSPVGLARQITGTITGRVVDEHEAVVPGASVTVESAELSLSRAVTTSADGYFTVPNLPPGTYRVRIKASGFADYVQDNIKLDVSGVFNLTARLRVGSAIETVTVVAQQYQTVNQETANVETLISGAQVTELSLNGRNWAQLLNLAPGTSAISNDAQQGTSVRIDDTAINGLRRRTAPTLDGISNVDHGSVGTQVNNISVDAIQEFKLVASPYSAEYGGQAGPAINVATKRGTSEFHGSLFEFFRHDKLNAYSWEARQRATPEKPRLRFNNFGGFLGGPLYRNKLFFFGGMEWKLPRTGRTVSEVVPTLAMRNGDFSAFLPANVPANNTSCTPAGITQTTTSFILCDKSGSTAGVAFPGNRIPAARMSVSGRALINLFPLPNDTTGTRFIAAPVTARDVRQELLRVDWQLSPGATIYGRWLRDHFDSDNPLGSSFDNQALPIAPDNHVRIGKTAMVSYNQVINPTLVNEFSVAWQRNDQRITYQNNDQISRATHGITFTEIFPENRLNKIPEFSVLGYPQLSGNGLPYVIDARSWEMRDNLTQTWGAHTFKAGFLFINSNKAENTRVRDGGQITFSSGGDAGTAFRPQDSGHAMANLLLGAYTRYTEVSNTTNAPSAYNQWEFYVNDQWRVSPRLSLTLGLRYQYIPWPSTELRNISGFDPSRFDASKAPLSANIASGVINLKSDPTGQQGRTAGFFDPYNGLILPGSGLPVGGLSDPNLQRLFTGRSSGLAESGANGWAPRFGFAWDLFGNGKTSLRGGAGIYYDRTLLNPVRDAGVNPPFVQNATLTNGRQATTPASVVSTFSNTLDTVGASGPGQPLVQTLAVFSPDMPPGAVYAWSLGVQRELPGASVIEINYVGNVGRHLTHRRDINFILPEVALLRNASGAFVNANADTVRQYLGYSAIRQQENTGVSSYNSLQVSWQKRLTRGFTSSVAYTWGKALTTFDVETSDQRVPFDASLDKGYANFDRRHVLAISYVYEFPFFKNQAGFSGHVLGGWQLSGITSVQSGQHVSVSGGSRASTAPANGYGGNLDLVGDWKAVTGGQTPDHWINPAAFAGRTGLIATLPRNLIELPRATNFNLSLMKRTRLTENVRVQFRVEAFNVFNHPIFRTVQTSRSASNFGVLTETEDPRVFQFGLKVLF